VRRLPERLRRLVRSAGPSIKALRELPDIQQARHEWDNRRPFPNDAQLLLMATLFSPSQSLADMDDAGSAALVVVLAIMALPDPLPEATWIDIPRRCIWADERLRVVHAPSV
jgi:hypothetical protein